MDTIYHDPQEYIRQLQSLLVSDKKKIGFLFGAGTSRAIKRDASEKSQVPAIKELTQRIIENLKETDKYKTIFDELKSELEDNFDIEHILSNIIQKKEVIGNGTLNSLTKEEFQNLGTEIKKAIKGYMSVHEHKDEIVKDLVHTDFAEWVGRANRKNPIEIFTTNYDFLFEMGLEYKSVPYYDGFVGGFEPFFDALSVDDNKFSPHCTKLWKIHGSLGWCYDKIQKKVLRKDPQRIEDKDILIYPSILKYSEAKKFPYVSLIDRMSNFLKQDDSVLFICGYSFSDAHINEVILSALKTDTTSHVFVLFYDEYCNDKISYTLQDDSKLAVIAKETKKMSVYGIRSAVIGGVFGDWKLKAEPDKEDTINANYYVDEDAPELNTEISKELERQEVWTGKGRFILPDFTEFVRFLTSMIVNNNFIKNEK
jgi:hypothetical protein